MADYAPNYTIRYKMKYRVLDKPHTATIRLQRLMPSAPAAGAAIFTDLLTAMMSRLFTSFTVIGADIAQADSDVFLPATPIPVGDTPSAVAGDSSFTPQYCSFVGRSLSGAPARLFLFGWNISPHAGDNTANDYRVLASEDVQVAAAIEVLNGEVGESIVANDNNSVVWYPYVNIGQNAGYQRKARRG